MRRLISNIEVETPSPDDFIASSNFILGELSLQSGPTLHLWIGGTTHHLHRLAGFLKIRRKRSSS
jgi:hypothetical protein